ncbi:MAG: NAD(P)/FAD-dependent oxidoreductase [Gammaproteobacteria bacterium]|nr:NAD(P)/FAD-dependent oxidoreductase [Gammaproteobacteria bacterium]
MPEQREFDVAIVGGGVAGPAMACALAKSGKRILLIERSADPIDTARGDHLQPVTCEWLAGWDALDEMWALGGEKRLGARYLTPDGGLVLDVPCDQLAIPHPYFLFLNHEEISAALLNVAARNAGFELLRPAAAKLVEAGERYSLEIDREGQRQEISASLVVAADGRQSRLRRGAGIDASTYQYRNPLPVFFAPRTFDDPRNDVRAYLTDHGVISVIPRNGDQWKIGWPVPPDELAFWRTADTAALSQRISAMVPELEGIQPRFAGVYPVAMVNAERWVDRNLVLIGDACHAMHPGRSQGMNTAIRAVSRLTELLTAQGALDDPGLIAGVLRDFEAGLKPSLDERLVENHARGLQMDQPDPAGTASLRANLASVMSDPAKHETYCLRAAGY